MGGQAPVEKSISPSQPEATPPAKPQPAPPALDVAKLRAEQNFGMALAAGIGAAIAGAALWAGVTVTTHYELGLMSVVVGVIVGKAVRGAGRGIDKQFGYAGAACALFGSVLGTFLSDVGILAEHQGVPFGEIMGRMNADFAIKMFTTLFQPVDVLFYAIAVYEAYRFSFKYRLIRKPGATPPKS